MNYENFKNKTFNELPELIEGSNFINCEFNASAKFERCNIENCKFNVKQYFYQSNIVNSICTNDSTFDKSNIIEEEYDGK